MKTLNNTQTKHESNSIQRVKQFSSRSIINLFIAATFIICTVNSISAQELCERVRYSVGVENFSSANGHGAFYAPMAFITSGRNTFGAGTLTQKRSMTTNGFKLSYQRNISGDYPSYSRTDMIHEREILQINLLAYVQYNNPLPLCKANVTQENAVHGDRIQDWANVKLSTMEVGAGFGLQINLTDNFCIKGSVAASVYHHLNQIQGMYHERTAPGLFLSTGITYRIHQH